MSPQIGLLHGLASIDLRRTVPGDTPFLPIGIVRLVGHSTLMPRVETGPVELLGHHRGPVVLVEISLRDEVARLRAQFHPGARAVEVVALDPVEVGHPAAAGREETKETTSNNESIEANST